LLGEDLASLLQRQAGGTEMLSSRAIIASATGEHVWLFLSRIFFFLSFFGLWLKNRLFLIFFDNRD
jgi:hypothetical protein